MASHARADILVHYTFGDSPGTATNLPLSVAGNLSSTPVIGKSLDGPVVPHTFTEWSAGNMAMALSGTLGDPWGGRVFELTLTADPGYTFQLTDFELTWGAWNTAGCSRGLSVWPNAEAEVGLHNSSGGDFTSTLGPSYPGWYMANWTPLAQRTDLTSLRVTLGLSASNNSFSTALDYVRISGNVLPVPSPATLGLLAFSGAICVARRRR